MKWVGDFFSALTKFWGGPDRANFQSQFEEWKKIKVEIQADRDDVRKELIAERIRHAQSESACQERVKLLGKHVMQLRLKVSELTARVAFLSAKEQPAKDANPS